MRYLGVDYGKRKVGLAISEGKIASPFKVILVNALKDALIKISAVIRKEEVDHVVIGMPESGEARKITQRFIRGLKKVAPLGCDIVEAEETLTTQNALNKMIEQGFSKKRRQIEDAYSAAIILQNYLDQVR